MNKNQQRINDLFKDMPQRESWDLFRDEEMFNHNVALSGQAGSGMVYLMQNIAATRKEKIFIFEGADFNKKFKDHFKSPQDFEGEVNVICLDKFPDPFSVINWDQLLEDNDYYRDIVAYLVMTLSAICRPYHKGEQTYNNGTHLITQEEKEGLRVAIAQTLTITYKEASLDKVANFITNPDLKKNLLEFIKQNPSLIDLSNLDLSKRINLFQIGDQSSMIAIPLQIVMQKIQQFPTSGERSIIMIDDIRYILSDIYISRFIGTAIRRIRAYGGAFFFSNQHLSSYYNNSYHKELFDNCNWKVLLKQRLHDDILEEVNKDFNHSCNIKLQNILPNLNIFNKKEAIIHSQFGGLSWMEFNLPEFQIRVDEKEGDNV